MKRFILLCLLELASDCFAQRIEFDRSFGDAGFVTGRSRSTIQKMVSLPDGKILCLGEYLDSMSIFKPALLKFDSNGALDSTFSDDGVLQDTSTKILDIPYPNTPLNFMNVQPDGRIYTVGSTYDKSRHPTFIFCYDTNGNPTLTFGKSGLLKLDSIENVSREILVGFTVTPENDLITCRRGYVKDESGYGHIFSKFDSIGCMDRSFGTDGYLFIKPSNIRYLDINVITALNDGSIICAGSDKSKNNRKTTLIKLNSNGTFNQHFGIDGKVIIDVDTCEDLDIYGFPYLETARNIVELEDHRLIVSTITDRRNRDCILRLMPDGSIDRTFGINGISEGFTRINDVVVLKDSSILVCNNFGYTHLDPNGIVDSALNQHLPFSIYCVTSQGDRNLLCGGFTMLNIKDPTIYYSLARLNLDSSVQVPEIKIQSKKVSIFPVPFRDVITFRSDQSLIRKITLYDLNGRCVYSTLTDYQSCTIRINLSKGIYVCKVETSKGVEYHKIAKGD